LYLKAKVLVMLFALCGNAEEWSQCDRTEVRGFVSMAVDAGVAGKSKVRYCKVT
jgi:hypothetical protein